MYGIVSNVYSKPEFGIPTLTFQLGGQIPDKINQLVSELYKQESSKFKNLGSNQPRLQELTSPNLLDCHYKPTDPEKIMYA